VILQRALVGFVCVLAFWRWRWWSLPLLAFLLAPGNIAYTDQVLTEGLGLSLAVLTMMGAVAYVDVVRSDPSGQRRTLGGVLIALVSLSALSLYMLRFTYAVFVVAPLVLCVVAWKSQHRSRALLAGVSLILLAGSFTVVLTLENRDELGVASPSSGSLPAHYYYAWQQVFAVNPENTSDPDLAVFYDDGFVHAFSRTVSAAGVHYSEQADLYESEIRSMFAAAEISLVGSQLKSITWSLAGGRLHDVSGVVSRVLSSTRSDVDQTVYLNSFALDNGKQAFADEFNDGAPVGSLITNPAGVRIPIPAAQRLTSLLLPLAIVVMLVGLFSNETRSLATVGLLVVLGTAVGVGVIRADNYRFLIASSAAGMTVASAILPSVVRSVTSMVRRENRNRCLTT